MYFWYAMYLHTARPPKQAPSSPFLRAGSLLGLGGIPIQGGGGGIDVQMVGIDLEL